jgi:hypothetical protein
VFTNSNQISPFMWEQVEVVNWGGGWKKAFDCQQTQQSL